MTTITPDATERQPPFVEHPALAVLRRVFGERETTVFIFTGQRHGKKLRAIREAFFEWPEQTPDLIAHVEKESNRQRREVYVCAHGLTERKRTKEYADQIS